MIAVIFHGFLILSFLISSNTGREEQEIIAKFYKRSQGPFKHMKCVNLSENSVLRCGMTWPFAKMPSGKDMIVRLEKNEAYVSWLQPKNGNEMFPAIKIKENFFTLSLRMMKAVWRHVRLKRGFINEENVPHVGRVLKIPNILLQEKIRTQERFNVSVSNRNTFFV
jgi:hypothetical protein